MFVSSLVQLDTTLCGTSCHGNVWIFRKIFCWSRGRKRYVPQADTNSRSGVPQWVFGLWYFSAPPVSRAMEHASFEQFEDVFHMYSVLRGCKKLCISMLCQRERLEISLEMIQLHLYIYIYIIYLYIYTYITYIYIIIYLFFVYVHIYISLYIYCIYNMSIVLRGQKCLTIQKKLPTGELPTDTSGPTSQRFQTQVDGTGGMLVFWRTVPSSEGSCGLFFEAKILPATNSNRPWKWGPPGSLEIPIGNHHF